jgi:naringenin degradation protein FdeJ
MRVLVTGADGFVGRALAAQLAGGALPVSTLTLTDRQFTAPPQASEASVVTGDLADPTLLTALLAPGFDLVFHLASIPGSLAEHDAVAGERANLSVPLALGRHLAGRRGPGNAATRLIFASSIAVYGPLGVEAVSVGTPTRPALSYGAHKLMTETYLTDLTRRGDLSAVSLRLPGVVARPPVNSGHGSAFMSLLFHRIAAGEAYDCPVPANSCCWWLSRKACVEALIHAARLGPQAGTVIQPPALLLTVAEVAEAAACLTGRPARIRWGDDATLTRLFGSMPPLDASTASAAGFAADADAEALARAAFEGVSQ